MKEKKIITALIAASLICCSAPMMAFADGNTSTVRAVSKQEAIANKKASQIFPSRNFRKALVANGILTSDADNHLITADEERKITTTKKFVVRYTDKNSNDSLAVRLTSGEQNEKFSIAGIEQMKSLENLELQCPSKITNVAGGAQIKQNQIFEIGNSLAGLGNLKELKLSDFDTEKGIDLSANKKLVKVSLDSILCKGGNVVISNIDTLRTINLRQTNLSSMKQFFDLSNNKALSEVTASQCEYASYIDLSNDVALNKLSLPGTEAYAIDLPDSSKIKVDTPVLKVVEPKKYENGLYVASVSSKVNPNKFVEKKNISIARNYKGGTYDIYVINPKKAASYKYGNSSSYVEVNFYNVYAKEVSVSSSTSIDNVDWKKGVEDPSAVTEYFNKLKIDKSDIVLDMMPLADGTITVQFSTKSQGYSGPGCSFNINYKYDGKKGDLVKCCAEGNDNIDVKRKMTAKEKAAELRLQEKILGILRNTKASDKDVSALIKETVEFYYALWDKYGYLYDPNEELTGVYAPAVSGSWQKDKDGNWRFVDKNNRYVKGRKVEIGGQFYSFDGNGIMNIGWRYEKNAWYYYNKKGEGTEGAMENSGWRKIGNTWYYFYDSGKMASNTMVGSYYVNKSGAWRTDKWVKSGSKYWYSLKEGGYPKSSFKTINKNTYYFDDGGWMKTGWLHDESGIWYYFNKKGEGTEGAMENSGWRKIGNTWYYFYDSGKMASNTMVGSYYVNKSGAWRIDKWVKSGSKYWYSLKEGSYPKSSFKTINKNTYYFDDGGWMKTGWLHDESGIWYYFNKKGEGTEGAMVTKDWKKIKGKWYYFYEDGVMAADTTINGWTVDSSGAYVA